MMMGMSMISMVKRMMMIGMVFKAAISLCRDVAVDEVDHDDDSNRRLFEIYNHAEIIFGFCLY